MKRSKQDLNIALEYLEDREAGRGLKNKIWDPWVVLYTTSISLFPEVFKIS
jgi:hypothetical protein